MLCIYVYMYICTLYMYMYVAAPFIPVTPDSVQHWTTSKAGNPRVLLMFMQPYSINTLRYTYCVELATPHVHVYTCTCMYNTN